MARLSRLCPVGVPEHVIQRGNNKQKCFIYKRDYIAYLKWLIDYSSQYQVDIHAWVLMTNHVHILCTPRQDNAISLMMQSLGRQYVGYFNKSQQRTGTLWEGRYKSCIVDSEHYLLKLYRYIELNPVRANMVAKPDDYVWSSYQINALGKQSRLCTPHPLYQALGKDDRQRRCNYQALFNHQIDPQTLKNIRVAINKERAFGDEKFKEAIETSTGQRLSPLKCGRPTGWRKN